MPQKMRMLFALFITLPLILCIELEPEFAESPIFPGIDKEQKEKGRDFNKKKTPEKDKILKELDSSISDLSKEIKNYISEKKENPNEKIIELLKKMIEANIFVTLKTCHRGRGISKNYNKCIDEKKGMINNLTDAVEDTFGQCPATIQYINNLPINAYYNLGLISKFIEYSLVNKEYIKKGKLSTFANLLDCLGGNIDNYWPAVSAQLGQDGQSDIEPLLKEMYSTFLINSTFIISNEMERKKELSPNQRRFDVYEEEILNILKEIKDSNKGQTLTVVLTCLATITILIGGFLLYRYIRRRKNSNLIENIKDLVTAKDN